MTNASILKMLESLGEWFEFKPFHYNGDLWIRAKQWYKWNGSSWAHIPFSKLPAKLKAKGK